MGGEEEDLGARGWGGRKAYWRSQSWSASRSSDDGGGLALEVPDKNAFGRRRVGAPPLTPRSQQNCKARSCLPPLQPLSIARRSVDEWPRAGSDDIGEWAQPPTPRGEESRVEVWEGKRNGMGVFDKECSKVADHVYVGGDAVARNREILRKNGITHVLNCVGFVCAEYFRADLVYKTLWLQDSPSEDITSILYDVFDYFEDVREEGGRVLVHCCQGVSRSTSLVIAYLMWRKGQSFEDAFDFVKAARGIANPNMGFASQLLQCQKRVHAIPLSPKSLLSMYRMAPHSPYDALHLVPKMLSHPSPTALDSRGAFILHVLSSIYVWVGGRCKPVMEKDAKAAAYQVVRYESVPGPVYTVEEGDEPEHFWEAFLKLPFLTDHSNPRLNKEEYDAGVNAEAGRRRVQAYDPDFDLFYKGLAGGVVPPFPSSGAPQETHLPARESNWSILRRKFVSPGTKASSSCVSASKAPISRVYSDSLLLRENTGKLNRAQLLSMDPSLTPPYPSPTSLSSDSSTTSKSCSLSPSASPSTTPSPRSFDVPNAVLPTPHFCLELDLVSAPSIAGRRRSLKLPTPVDDDALSATALGTTHYPASSAQLVAAASVGVNPGDAPLKPCTKVDGNSVQYDASSQSTPPAKLNSSA